MSERLDELINKYLDGELDEKELREYELLIKEEENKKVLSVFQKIDSSLRKEPDYSLSPSFTSSVMMRIQRNLKARKEQKRFIIIVTSIFISISLLIVGFILYQLIGAAASSGSTLVTHSVDQLKNGIEYMTHFLPKQGISLLGAFISFGLLISAWFFVDFRNKKI